MWRLVQDPSRPLARRRVAVVQGDKGVWVGYPGGAMWVAAQAPPVAAAPGEAAASWQGVQQICAPMVGRVVQLPAQAGQCCEKGASLVVLEAMKMEYRVGAPAMSTVLTVHCALGDWVELNAVLVTLRCHATVCAPT